MSDGLLSELATRLGKKLALTTDDWEKYNPSISFDVLSRCEAKVLYPHLRLQNGIAHDHDFVPGATVATFARGELVIDDRDRIGKVLSNDEHGIIVCFSNVEPQFLIPGEYRFFGCLTHWDGYRKGARR